MDSFERASKTQISRRTVAKAIAWAGPTIAVAATVPLAAASLRKDPGINGWVLNSYSSDRRCEATIDVNSNPANPQATPDGAPYGLYVYDVENSNVITAATLTYWIIGDHTTSNTVTWTAGTGHSSCWGSPTMIGTETKPDGYVYTGYRWTYTCAINPNARVVGSDGVERLFLGHFRSVASFSQPRDLCGNITFWTQRHITIDPDGAGSMPPTVHTFQRRNGSLGPMSSALRAAPRSAPAAAESGKGNS